MQNQNESMKGLKYLIVIIICAAKARRKAEQFN